MLRSLIYVMHAIAHAQVSTRATSPMHVKITWATSVYDIIVWGIGMKKTKEQKYQIAWLIICL